MRTYELMVIFDGDLEEAEVASARTSVRGQIDEVADVVHEDYWGRREFAYEIDHKRHGFYAIVELTAEPGALDPVERSLRIADNVVRHKLIRLPDHEAARRLAERAADGGEPSPDGETSE